MDTHDFTASPWLCIKRYNKRLMKNIIFPAAVALFFCYRPCAVLAGDIKKEIAGDPPAATETTDRQMRDDDDNLKAIPAAFDKTGTRENVKHHNYNPEITYKIQCHGFMPSTVVLPQGEIIAGHILGDAENFSFTPMGKQNRELANKFQVIGKFHGADTNLIVFGLSGNIYSFYLRNDPVKSRHMPALVTYIQDKRVSGSAKIAQDWKRRRIATEKASRKEASKKSHAEYLASIPKVEDRKTLNLNYAATGGDISMKPLSVWDDGYFTYFQFFFSNDINKVKKLPDIYMVVDGYDTPVNTRIEGWKVVAETVNDKWTLRSGSAYLCIHAKPGAMSYER